MQIITILWLRNSSGSNLSKSTTLDSTYSLWASSSRTWANFSAVPVCDPKYINVCLGKDTGFFNFSSSRLLSCSLAAFSASFIYGTSVFLPSLLSVATVLFSLPELAGYRGFTSLCFYLKFVANAAASRSKSTPMIAILIIYKFYFLWL